jgi:hypothetical protein
MAYLLDTNVFLQAKNLHYVAGSAKLRARGGKHLPAGS